MTHAVVRTDNMYGTDNRSGLVSIKYITEVTEDETTKKVETEIDNGNVLKVGPLMEGEREIFEGYAVAANDALEHIVLVVTPELIYDERLRNLDDFYNKAGRTARAYRLHKGDLFSVTKEAFVNGKEPNVGDVVELAAGTKLNAAASATSGATAVGKVIAKETAGRYTYFVIHVGA